MLVALYERAVAVYAELINVNAFHQPGVQAYKLASKGVIKLVTDLEKILPSLAPWAGTIEGFCKKAELTSKEAEVEGILAKFAENAHIRSFDKFKISRRWSESQGWIYSLETK